MTEFKSEEQQELSSEVVKPSAKLSSKREGLHYDNILNKLEYFLLKNSKKLNLNLIHYL